MLLQKHWQNTTLVIQLLFKCVYVCVYACLSVCLSVYLSLCTYGMYICIKLYARVYVLTLIYVLVCMHTYMSIFVSVLLSQIQCTHTYACIHVYICAYVCEYTWFAFILQALEHDVEAFVSEVQRLEKIARELVSQGHFDTANINARQVCMYCYVSIVINIIPIEYP